MIDTLYNILVGSLLVVGIVLIWIVIIALFVATQQQLRKRR